MTLCHDQAIRWAKAKVHVSSDSVLCLGRISHPSEAKNKWKEQIQYFQQSNEYAEMSGLDGKPIEFEWNIFPGFTSIEILKAFSDKFEGTINFMSMFNDIDWTKNEHSGVCISNAREVRDLRQRVAARALVIPWSCK